MSRFKIQTVVALFCVGLVMGCESDSKTVLTGGPESQSITGTVTKLGAMDINDVNADYALEMFAAFIEFSEPVSVEGLSQELARGSAGEDDCDVYIGAESQEVLSSVEIAAENASAISAGEIITVSGSAGSVAELQRPEGIDVYFGDVQATEQTAGGLIVDIPGDDFPAFNSVDVPDVANFVLTNELVLAGPFGEDVSIDTIFTWEPNDDPATRVILYTDLSFNSSGLEETQRIDIDCILQDDGSFTLPVDVKVELTDLGYTELPLYIGRESVSVHQQGDALLIVTRSSGPLE